jgi:branched-chain amino acid transport system substrate-binding protein
MRALLLCFLLTGCRDHGAARIGDGYPRDQQDSLILAAIRPAVESAGVQVVPWSVSGGPLWSTIQLNTDQARLFADDPSVVAVVGHPGSRDALLGAAVYNARGVPNVVPNGTSSRLARSGPWTFMLVPDDSVQGEFIANYAMDSLKAQRISVLYLGDEYGLGLRDGIRAGLERRGVRPSDETMIPTEECFSARSGILFESIVRGAMRRTNPDVFVVTAGTSNGWCIADFIHNASPATWVVFSDGMDGAHRLPDPPRGLPDRRLRVIPARIRGVEFWAPGTDSLNRAFVERVATVIHRSPDASQALQYDAYMLLAAAVNEVGRSRPAVREWLESLGRTRPPWLGVTGPIAFNHPRSEILRMSGPNLTVP